MAMKARTSSPAGKTTFGNAQNLAQTRKDGPLNDNHPPGFCDNRPEAAMQRKIGEAATHTKTPRPATSQPIQREILLKNADDNIYEDSDSGKELGFLGKNGNKQEYIFADYDGLTRFMDAYDEVSSFVNVENFVGNFRKYSDYKETYGPFYLLNSNGELAKWNNLATVFFQQRLIEVLRRGGSKFWEAGSSNRYPRPIGKLGVEGNFSREQVLSELGVQHEKFPAYSNVQIFNMSREQLEMKKKELLHHGDNVITTENLVYLSERSLPRSKNARVRAMGKKYDDKFSKVEENSIEHNKLDESFREMGTPESEGWVKGFNNVPRGEGQEKAMSKWNALGAAAYANRFHNQNFDLRQNWEWLHVRGAQIGGKTDNSNLVSGLYAVNSRMIPYENKIKAWDQKDPGKLKARFYTEGEKRGPFAEKIVIDVATSAAHAALGQVPDNDPIRFSFYTLTGKVVDKLTGQIEAYKLDKLVKRNQQNILNPGENQLALLPSYQAHQENAPARFMESFGKPPLTLDIESLFPVPLQESLAQFLINPPQSPEQNFFGQLLNQIPQNFHFAVEAELDNGTMVQSIFSGLQPLRLTQPEEEEQQQQPTFDPKQIPVRFQQLLQSHFKKSKSLQPNKQGILLPSRKNNKVARVQKIRLRLLQSKLPKPIIPSNLHK